MMIGIEDILENIVKLVPPPPDNRDKPLRALIFDSYYDPYRGVIVYFRVMDGAISKGDKVRAPRIDAAGVCTCDGGVSPPSICVRRNEGSS
jgi:translation elongation factor EF-4